MLFVILRPNISDQTNHTCGNKMTKMRYEYYRECRSGLIFLRGLRYYIYKTYQKRKVIWDTFFIHPSEELNMLPFYHSNIMLSYCCCCFCYCCCFWWGICKALYLASIHVIKCAQGREPLSKKCSVIDPPIKHIKTACLKLMIFPPRRLPRSARWCLTGWR